MTFARMALGAVLGLALLLGAMFIEGGSMRDVLQLTAFLLVGGTTGGFLLIGYPVKVQLRSLALAFGKSGGTRPELQTARQYFAAMGAAFVMFGVIGAMIGTIQVMKNLDHPEEIGPGIAVAFTSILYGFLFRGFFAAPLGDAVAATLVEAERTEGASPTPKTAGAPIAIAPTPGVPTAEVAALHAKIGELVMKIENRDKPAA